MPPALFDQHDGAFIATEHSRGPWDPGSCHGGPVAALMVRAVERTGDGGSWQLARITLELLRPVPIGDPLVVTTEIERPGKRVSLVGATLRCRDREIARARALRIALGDLALPDDLATPGPPPLPDPATIATTRMEFPGDGDDLVAFHNESCEHRYAQGAPHEPGPVAVWIRLAVPVVDGEEPSGPQRTAAAADFGNGVSATLPFEDYTFINPELTVHLSRPPQGEWIGMRTESHYAASGAGFAESSLYDMAGRLGRSVQSLLVAAR